ncbi:hypothetical protein [Sodalis-like endosymbiont of Proechinophthirus fluctus]|uniref:hypothetical protein n=1 Tax=Sodalis-like endosymbiont of Proechinophthirus fluctus TaxID=1462730 RepID=UPI000A53EC11
MNSIVHHPKSLHNAEMVELSPDILSLCLLVTSIQDAGELAGESSVAVEELTVKAPFAFQSHLWLNRHRQ